MRLEDILFKSDSHIVAIGRTRSGKSHTVAKIIELLSKRHKYYILLDWSGEYSIPGIQPVKPVFSFKLLKNSLPEILSEMIRIQSSTAGTWTYDAVAKIVDESNNFNELLQKLKENSEFPVRDSGARAAHIRLSMLRHLFTEGEVALDHHITFHSLQITARKMALAFYLVQLYNLIILKQYRDLFIVVEEALNIPEDLLKQLLTQLAGYNIRLILVTQEFKDWFLQYNVILHDLGGNNRDLIYRHGVPHHYDKLKVGRALLFWVDKHKWSKEKIKPSKLIEIMPKYENTVENSGEAESIEESEEVKDEAKDENNNENKEIEKNEENNQDNNVEQDNNNKSSRDPRIERVLEEHKILSDEHKRLASEVGNLYTALKDVKQEVKDVKESRDLEAEVEYILSEKNLLILPGKVDEIEKRVNSLELNKLEQVREQLENLSSKVDEILSYIDEFKEQLSKLSNRVKEIEDEVYKPNEIKIDDGVKEEKEFISKVEKELNIELKFTVHGDKVIVQPIPYLGKKFGIVDEMLREHGYRRDRNEQYGWHWYKMLIGRVRENA